MSYGRKHGAKNCHLRGKGPLPYQQARKDVNADNKNTHQPSGDVAVSIRYGAAFGIGCKSQEMRSCWVDDGIVVDGKIDDWSGLPTTYFEDQAAVVGLCNDAENLYIHLRTKDAKYAGLIKRTGLAIFIDNSGSKNKDFYIKFYAGPDMAEMRPRMDRPGGEDGAEDPSPMMERFGRLSADQSDRLVCYVKDRIAEMSISPDGAQGPGAAYDTSMGFYSYEFSIPLAGSAVRHYGIDCKPGQKISIGAVWGEVNRDEMRKSMGDRGDRPEGGGMPGGGMGGGPPGGGMGGGPPDGMKMPQKQEVWVETTLSTPVDNSQTQGES